MAFSAAYPNRPFTEWEINHYYADIKLFFNDNNIVVPDQPQMRIDCPEGPEECFVDVCIDEGVFYASCCRNDVPMMVIEPEKVKCVRTDMQRLCHWMATQYEFVPEPKEVNQWTWFLGKYGDGYRVYMHFDNTPSHAEEQLMTINKQNQKVVLLWLGDTPHEGVFSKNIVSFWDAFECRSNDVLLNSVPIMSVINQRNIAISGDLELDQDIVLHTEGNQKFLFFNREKQGFKHKISIRPQAARIIEFLHTVSSNAENAFALGDLLGRKFAANKNTISTRIKEINDFCSQYHVKAIFFKYMGDKWGLNQQLDCCD